MISFFPEQTDLENIFRDVIEFYLIPRFLELNMRATGEWEANLDYRVEGVGTSNVTAYISGRDYTEELVHGTPPGTLVKIPELQKWAMAKFGYSYDEALGVAYAVRETILQKGTTWYQDGGSSLLEVLEEPEVTTFIRNRVSVLIQSKVELYFIRELKKFEKW